MVTEDKGASTVIKDILASAMQAEKEEGNNSRLYLEAAKKSIMFYRILESYSKENKLFSEQVITEGKQYGLQEIENLTCEAD